MASPPAPPTDTLPHRWACCCRTGPAPPAPWWTTRELWWSDACAHLWQKVRGNGRRRQRGRKAEGRQCPGPVNNPSIPDHHHHPSCYQPFDPYISVIFAILIGFLSSNEAYPVDSVITLSSSYHHDHCLVIPYRSDQSLSTNKAFRDHR